MIPKDILKKIRQIQIKTSRTVNDILAGQYHSVFKGRGMEFDEVREYQVGDDIRSIDWNVTARTGVPHIKKFIEERELSVLLVVDASASGIFGSTDKLKQELAAEVCALLAFSAIKNNDKVGLIIFTDEIERYIPPKKGINHVLRVIREVLYMKPRSRGTNISVALEFMSKVITHKAVCFLVSDFMTEGYKKPLHIANKRHDIIAVTISDPREYELPPVGLIELIDAENGESLLIDLHDRQIAKSFKKDRYSVVQQRDEMFRSMSVDSIHLSTAEPYIEPLIRFFKLRERRIRT